MLVVPTGKQRWRQSLAERRTIRAVVVERGHVENGTLTVEQLDEILDVLDMTRLAAD